MCITHGASRAKKYCSLRDAPTKSLRVEFVSHMVPRGRRNIAAMRDAPTKSLREEFVGRMALRINRDAPFSSDAGE